MKRFLAALPVLALLASLDPALARSPQRGGLRPLANPSALIAAELAFSRLAQDKGQWTAFAETAAPDAEMFVPQRVAAPEWLKKRASPPAAVKWQAHAVWISCDGSAGVTRGAWQSGAGGSATGWFTTVWHRQKKGDYKWVLDQGDAAAAPIAAPDFLEGKVADCPARKDAPDGGPAPDEAPRKERKAGKDAPVPLPPLAGPLPPLDAPAGADAKDGRSTDGTLAWRSVVLPGGARDFTAWMWKDGAMAEVVHTHAAAPKAG
ncbi:hypothetical protein OLX02_04330 [Novosphingobium sp. KCTC 2891]|uniref:hypothetical protein n=1 Tax=Novosphingobium sp. KCTC 2891 TaxID=2989730 RepID=UPI0022228D06|nr:hypothetical protein [Novosphingobium sp. KCTC 2891]MCW1382042.1 hypothetical protein [Novosphingobium sp. KCTC 2891]